MDLLLRHSLWLHALFGPCMECIVRDGSLQLETQDNNKLQSSSKGIVDWQFIATITLVRVFLSFA